MPALRCRAALAACGVLLAVGAAHAQSPAAGGQQGSGFSFGSMTFSDRLVLTGGVTSIEGAAGGGLTPWAVIGGQGTRNQVGGRVFATYVPLNDYDFYSFGGHVGLFDRVEFSYARQVFDTNRVGGDLATLGLPTRNDFTFSQDVFGVKLRLFGNLVFDQDSLLPQVAVGAFYKQNDRGNILRAIGARRDSDFEYYVSATKLFLSQSVLVNATLRATRANQFGILGFGGDRGDQYKFMPEGSIAYLISRTLAVGAEYRFRPNNLGIAKEDDAYDVFIAYQPLKNVSFTLAYAVLGNVVTEDNQRGLYFNLNLGF